MSVLVSIGRMVRNQFFLTPKKSGSLYENPRGSPTLTLPNVLGLLGVLNVLNVVHVLHVLHVLYVLHVLHTCASCA